MGIQTHDWKWFNLSHDIDKILLELALNTKQPNQVNLIHPLSYLKMYFYYLTIKYRNNKPSVVMGILLIIRPLEYYDEILIQIVYRAILTLDINHFLNH
jgi:hypothetical protein